jgi:hypothetical protein
VALEAAEGDRAQADGKQGHGAGDGQGDTGEGLRCRAGEVEEMIQRRLEERSWPGEEVTWQKEHEEGRWPATFS